MSLALAYLFCHQLAQRAVQALHGAIGADHFAHLFVVLGFGTLLAAAGSCFALLTTREKRSKRGSESASILRKSQLPKTSLLSLWCLVGVAALLSHYFLVAVDSELIHWLQYGILYGFFLKATSRLGQAAIWTLLAGILDETYQFWVLQRNWNIYLDFNDVVLNGIGVLLAMAVAASILPIQQRAWNFRPLSRGLATRVAVGLLISLAGCLTLGICAWYKSSDPQAWFVLSRSDPPPEFWVTTEWARRGFHILSPMAGLAFTTLLLVFFSVIDGRWQLDTTTGATSENPANQRSN